MKLSALLSLVGLVATASAAPVKRGLPRLGGINLAVSVCSGLTDSRDATLVCPSGAGPVLATAPAPNRFRIL